MDNRQEAKRLLRHYFRLVGQRAGVLWTGDNDAELDTLVDCLVDAAKDELDAEEQRALEFFTVDDVSSILGVSGKLVRQWIRDGALQGVRLGPGKRLFRVRRSDLDAFTRRRFE